MRLGFRFRLFLSTWAVAVIALGATGLLWQFYPQLGGSLALRWSLIGILAVLACIASAFLSRTALEPFANAAQAALRYAAGGQPGRSADRATGTSIDDVVGAFKAATEAAALRIQSLEESLLTRTAALSSATEELGLRNELRARETRMALRMQRRIVPRAEELPTRPELAFGALYEPCENTGGDLYDAERAGKNGYTLLTADVSGRGVTAALIAALVKSFFRSRATWGVEVTEVLSAVNQELLAVLGDSEHFVTAFYALLDLESGALSYAIAGHPPALLLRRRRGRVEDLGGAGPALGVIESAAFARGDTRMEEGDRLLLFTDGVTGARNPRGEGFGRERLAAALTRAAGLPTSEIPSALLAELEEFCSGSPRSDDAVLLACELRAFARPEPRDRPPANEDRDWRVLARRGASLASAGKVEEAMSVYERLLELEPEDAAALNNLGAILWRMGRREEAAARFREASRFDPVDSRIKRNLEMAERPSRRRQS